MYLLQLVKEKNNFSPGFAQGRSTLLLFYLLFIMIVFQVQNVHLQLAIGVFGFLPNAVERISKGTKAVADPGGGLGGGWGRGPDPPSEPILV